MIVKKKEWVKLKLIQFPDLRDSNEKLYYVYLKEIGYDIDVKSAIDLLQDMNKRKIPYLDSISRASRLVQEEYSHLRGKNWNKRKKKSVEVKHEILAHKAEN
tara:strand:+ start:354 stop:659 length:306 start_codon:yes stop_codon:yes gene_type:complete